MSSSPTLVKICGLRDEAGLQAAINAGADYLGFVFVPNTPRYIAPHDARDLIHDKLERIRPEGRKIVAVMSDPSDRELAEILRVFAPDSIQLHGNETPERVREIGGLFEQRLWKAIGVAGQEDIDCANHYRGYADRLVLDTKTVGGQTGGTGQVFDWSIIKNNEISIPWILSGGLTPQNVREAIMQTKAKTVDVSSGVEREKGVKDTNLIHEFIKNAKHDISS